MKIKNLVLTASLVFSVATFAQKNELKTAEKALKGEILLKQRQHWIKHNH